MNNQPPYTGIRPQLSACTWNFRLPGGTSIFMIAENSKTERYISSRIRHSFWALDYAYIPGTRYRVGTRNAAWQIRQKQTAHLYPPDTSYWERREESAGPSYSAYICFWRGEDAGLKSILSNEVPFVRFEDPECSIGNLLQEGLSAIRHGEDESFWQAQAILFRILGLLMEAHPVSRDTYRVENNRCLQADNGALVRAVHEYLMAHLDRRVTLSEIATHLSVSRSTLTHAYGKQTGEGPLTTHMRLRMDVIKQQLLLNEPLKYIAAHFGFSDIYHLSKAFRKLVGMSPRAYCRSVR